MKAKVSLKEIVGTKIIYAILLVCYYWMWARRDWQNHYEVIQHMIIIFTIIFLQSRYTVSTSRAKKKKTSRQFKSCAE